MTAPIRNDFGTPETTASHPDAPAHPNALDRFRHRAFDLVEAQNEVDWLTAQLKAATEYRNRLAEIEVPEASRDADRDRVVFDDGTQVQVEKRLHCSIKADQKPHVLLWLKETAQNDIITLSLTVPFKAGEIDEARLLKDLTKMIREHASVTSAEVSVEFKRSEYDSALACKKAIEQFVGPGRTVTLEPDVHSATLKKFVGQQYFLTGRLAALHPGISYFNDNHAVVVRPEVPPNDDAAETEENPL
jgi:hypothetical protein